MFLTQPEIEKLTGHTQKARQKRALDAMKIRYEENPIGDLLVSKAYIERRLSGQEAGNDAPVSRINFGYLDRYAKAQG